MRAEQKRKLSLLLFSVLLGAAAVTILLSISSPRADLAKSESTRFPKVGDRVQARQSQVDSTIHSARIIAIGSRLEPIDSGSHEEFNPGFLPEHRAEVRARLLFQSEARIWTEKGIEDAERINRLQMERYRESIQGKLLRE